MSMKINTSQLTGLQAKLDVFKDSIKTEVAFSGVAAMATVIYDEARANCPVSSAGHWFHGKSFKKNGTKYWFEAGTLKGAIYRVYSPEKSSDTLKLYRVSWNRTKAPYGYMVEFGTSSAPATPFMRPAASRVGDAIKAGQARMSKRIDEIKGAT